MSHQVTVFAPRSGAQRRWRVMCLGVVLAATAAACGGEARSTASNDTSAASSDAAGSADPNQEGTSGEVASGEGGSGEVSAEEGSSGEVSTEGSSGEVSSEVSTEVSSEEGTKVEFDAANFVDPTLDTNPYHPLEPGTQWVYGGTTLVGDREVPHEIIVTITDVIREIDGAPTVAMLSESTDSGEVAQVGMDYMALDEDGNVWILGGYTEEFEGGEYTNTESAWLGTAEGQRVGILTPSDVTMETPRWFIAGAPDESPSIGEPVEIGASTCVKFACYEDVRIVQEGEVGAPDNEHKYYAPGVGVINNVPLDASLHKDRFELLNFLELSPDGLAEASQTVLDLETHALETAPEVYGAAPESTRAP